MASSLQVFDRSCVCIFYRPMRGHMPVDGNLLDVITLLMFGEVRAGRGSSPERGKIFVSSVASRLARGPTQPFIQWEPGIFPWG
jgi:hypothetical protein